MRTEEIKSNLCYYDPENPNNNLEAFDETDRPQPRNGCVCDNCFYGRDALAVQILNTQLEFTVERALADRLAEAARIMWPFIEEEVAIGFLTPGYRHAIEAHRAALAAWKEARSE